MSGLVHPTICVAWLWLQSILGEALIFCVEVLLIMRGIKYLIHGQNFLSPIYCFKVFAFYDRNKVLLAILLILFLCETVSMVVVGALSTLIVIPNPFPPDLHFSACTVIFVSVLFTRFWCVTTRHHIVNTIISSAFSPLRNLKDPPLGL
jgi:hypothetical protein